MKKRALAIILTLTFIFTMILSIPVFAAGSVTLNKTQFTVGEKGQATVSGLTSAQIDGGAFLGIAEVGTRYENTYHDTYVADLPANNVWIFEAPNYYGEYEVRLLDADYNLLSSAAFSVVAPQAGSSDITISKTEVRLREPMSVTVNGLTNEMLDNGAWLGIEKYDEKLANTYHDTYISYLPANNTYEFEAPFHFGKYEVRVFSSYNEDPEDSFFGKVEFTVVPGKAKEGDIVLSKTRVLPEEKMSVTVKGLTPGEIKEGAWLGIAKSEERLQNTYHDTYISSLPINDTHEFTAPTNPGAYEVRVFCTYGVSTPEEYEYALFGTAKFVVSTDAAGGDIAAGEEGLSAWAVKEVNEARDENLVTDKVLVDFPEDITREEFCELAVLLYEKMTGIKAVPEEVNPFSDTNNPEILKAYKLGIVGGIGGGKFAPGEKVTREQISAMFLRTLKAVMPEMPTDAQFATQFQDQDNISAWALESVRFMNANDIIKGTTVNGVSYLLPQGNTTKEQAIALVLRIYNKFGTL
jgi:hypothetical protein